MCITMAGLEVGGKRAEETETEVGSQQRMDNTPPLDQHTLHINWQQDDTAKKANGRNCMINTLNTLCVVLSY